MNEYVATFHTHLSAMRTQKTLAARGISARLTPVPRALSASCGTCVRYSADYPALDAMDRDFEKVVLVKADESGYEPIGENLQS